MKRWCSNCREWVYAKTKAQLCPACGGDTYKFKPGTTWVPHTKEHWLAILAIVIFIIILVIIGANSSPVEFDPSRGEFVPKDSAQPSRPIP